MVKTRALHREGAQARAVSGRGLVGYTNAGKSTLFNRLTGADVLAKDQLFATLDPTMRAVALPHGRRIILSDTVGFISDLPTTLVAAFRATLEEVLEADLILHVRDISHPETEPQQHDVEAVLADLGIEAAAADAPILEVWNKSDRLSEAARSEAERGIARSRAAARAGLGADGRGDRGAALRHRRPLRRKDEVLVLEIPAREGRLLSWLHDNAEVLGQETAESGAVTTRFRIDPAIRGKLDGQLKRAGLAPSPHSSWGEGRGEGQPHTLRWSMPLPLTLALSP